MSGARSVRRRILWTALAIVGLGALTLGALYGLGKTPLVYVDRDAYPIRGVDVSHHQDAIDWTALAGADVSFAFIKATEGGDFRDPRFAENWRGAGEAGLPRGAYHFFRFCTPAALQAQNYLSALPEDAELPPVLDVEYGGNCTQNIPSDEAIVARLDSVIQAVEATTGRAPLLYVLPDSYRDFVQGRFDLYPIWYQSVLRAPRLPGDRPWTFWQYTVRARLPGVGPFVDLNVFNGTPSEFAALVES